MATTSPRTTESPFLTQAQALKNDLISVRRTIHANPELSFFEKNTASLVATRLAAMGCAVKTGVGSTGVIGEIGNGGPLIGLRADMDALPIDECNDAPYRSSNPSVMHACGHDAHTACLIGAAQILTEHLKANKVEGRFRFVFQPAEERVNQQGKSGAGLMIDDGVLDGVEALIGLHVHPTVPVGMVALRAGPALAACDSFEATIIGKGGHGAEPHVGLDAIVLATNAIQVLQQVVSRRKAAVEPAVITVGGIRSNTYAPNILAESVELTGTVRYFNPAMHDFLKKEIEEALGVVRSLGAELSFEYRHENPALINDSQVTSVVSQVAAELLGSECVMESPLHMGAEDFSFYTEHVPSCYFILGVAIDGSPRELHTSTFDINEDALPIGSALLAQSALRLLALKR